MRRALAIAVTVVLLSLSWAAQGVRADPRSFRLTLVYTYINQGNRVVTLTEDDVSMPLFVNNSWVTVYLVRTEPPTRVRRRDGDGNLYIVLRVDRVLRPREKAVIKAEYRILSRERSIPEISEADSGTLGDISHDLVEDYCSPAGPWRYDEWEAVREKALTLKGNETNVLRIVRRFVDWVREAIEYPKLARHEVPYYPNVTLHRAKGDCDDQANLLITMCRAVGIPAYLQLGCVYLRMIGERTYSLWDGHYLLKSRYVGWHGWAMVYIPPWGWLPVDLTWRGIGEYSFIEGAAVSYDYTIPCENVTRTDYILETLNERDRVRRSDIFIVAEQVMTPLAKDYLTPAGEAFESVIVPFLVASLMIAVVVAIAVRIVLEGRDEHPTNGLPGR